MAKFYGITCINAHTHRTVLQEWLQVNAAVSQMYKVLCVTSVKLDTSTCQVPLHKAASNAAVIVQVCVYEYA